MSYGRVQFYLPLKPLFSDKNKLVKVKWRPPSFVALQVNDTNASGSVNMDVIN